MRRTVVAAVLTAAAATACGPEAAPSDGGARVEVSVSPTPAAVGDAQVRVDVTDPAADTPPRSDTAAGGTGGRAGEAGGGEAGEPGAAVVVVTARPDDGGAPVIDTARAWRPGVWIVDAFGFDRPGEWTLEVRAELPDGRTVRGRHPIRVVGR